MRIYTVHVPDEDPVVRAEAVKEGFSWPAFVFSVVWALWHGLWLAAIVFLAAILGLGLLIDTFGGDALIQGVVSLGLALIIGWTANDVRRHKLRKKGFAHRSAIIADTGEAAIRRYFEAAQEMAAQEMTAT